jgi:excisionase family DNA binding protein|tara:strand:+ start:220 stop:543 length:324 start_codon:yes stop_codon:yes gene_type:complete
MKAEFNVDTDELISKITQEVRKAIKPLLGEMAVNDTIFTVETLAKYLHVSRQWIYERTHMKEIPYSKIGKFPRFRKSEIDKWLDSSKIPTMQPLSSSLKLGKRIERG